MDRSRITRRQFVKRAALGGAGLSLASSAAPARGVLGANEKIVVGCIGVGGQGTAHVSELAKMPDVAIAAVCDVDRAHCENAARVAGSSPHMCKDFREVLDRKDIDAVFVVTPDHWHAIPAIEACKAGKDVFVEKPIGHNIREGRAIVEAARAHNRVTSVGMQQRTTPHWAHAVQRIRAGELGKVHMVHVWNAWNTKEMGGKLGRPADADPPPGVDYDLWLGPAPLRRFNPARFHFGFYFFWDYAGGMMSDWAVHLFDVVAWAMGPDITSVSAVGGKYVLDDARDTPDTASAVFECPGYTLMYSLRHANGWRPHGDMDHGIEFFGKDMTLQINRRGFEIYREEDRTPRKPFYRETGETRIRDHERNFLECVRTRKQTHADAETGHHAAIFGHLANIAYRVGRRIRWDSKTETIVGDPEASRLLGREYRKPWHL